MTLASLLQYILNVLGVCAIGYLCFLGLLAIPFFQNQAIYLHSVTLTWFQDVSIAEQWGFLRNQVTPFTLRTPDGVTLFAWHILPLELYPRHEEKLVKEPDGVAVDITDRVSFQLLRDDPEALLVLYLHGAAGTLGSGWRPPSYRAMSAGAPDKIHTVAIDYRGFGSSSGSPSEQGLLTDAITLAEWAMHEARVPPSRIVIFGQSLGTAVGIALAHHYAMKPDPLLFSGMVLVAPFADVELLTATYRIGGIIPILGPLSPFPRLLAFFNALILSKWPSKDRLAAFVRECESMSGNDPKYHITIIHAQDDYDIPWSHSDQLFWNAVSASLPEGISFDDLEKEKAQTKRMLGPAGWVAEHRTAKGLVREEITKFGLHDRIMSYPIVSLAVLRAFKNRNSVL
ncbi:1e5b256f-d64e-423f-aa7b-510159ebd150 [Thermothielavioides terrestris]|uniref:1e5b256f-d64e-423f-aa7b-510159ebd150 n=1 Tax=Thermothielavioides terrestris TaxID=2587410 RepID=A0A3S4AJI9_9PEZI|nr:1e5b256f-d64e-423f-aa7b-510159ebd150 [Thermothielavioides terrestris]